jgi:phenylacetate-CoA ligase
LKTRLSEAAYIRFYELSNHRSLWPRLEALTKSQWYTDEELQQLRLKKLQTLLKHAYCKVPFYRQSFKKQGVNPFEITEVEDLSKFPLFRKKDLQLNYPHKLLARSTDHSRGFSDATGGTSGGSTRYFVGQISAEFRAANAIRNQHWYNFYYGESNALIWGAQRDLTSQGGIIGSIQQLILNRVELNAWRMSEKRMNAFADVIRKKKPKVLVGFSSAVALFASHCLENGICLTFPSGIVISGESIDKEQTQTIERAFKNHVFNRYGSREFGSIAHECRFHQGLHINAESFIIERGAAYGDSNSLIITDLNNYSMPFIRYEIGDVGTLSKKTCDCGRGLSMIDRIEGRTLNFLVTQDGCYVNGTIFPHILRYHDEIREFAVRQDTISEIDIFVVLNRPLQPETLQKIRDDLQEFIGKIRVNFVEVDNLPLSKSGKRVLVYSSIINRE